MGYPNEQVNEDDLLYIMAMNPVEKVKSYYSGVDAGDMDSVINLFSDNGEYQRADAHYSGKKAIADFYNNDRKIQGKHSLENVVAEGNTIIANGVFDGCGADGSPRHVGFADVWIFDNAGKVTSRKTYLAIGSDYVRN